MSAAIHRRIRLRHEEVLFTVSSEILDLISDPTVHDLPIRRFDKAKFVDARERAHRADQANIRTFGRFDRTNSAVVRWMNVAHFKAGALAAQTSRAESRQAALVGQFCKRIRLIHELRKL